MSNLIRCVSGAKITWNWILVKANMDASASDALTEPELLGQMSCVPVRNLSSNEAGRPIDRVLDQIANLCCNGHDFFRPISHSVALIDSPGRPGQTPSGNYGG